MKHYQKILALLLCWSTFFYGQSDTDVSLPTFVPPTPEAAALGKFIDIPISSHTGVAPIGVPLCNIPAKDIQIPISLSYHASGIRVDQFSTRVGLGWSLSGQGSVTRSVRGIPDDAPDGFLNTSFTIERFKEASAGVSPGDPVLGDLQDFYGLGLRNEIDLESDIYYYNLPGGTSGKFYFKQSGEIVMMPYNQDVQIIPVKENGYIKGWEITIANGVHYYLGMSKNQIDTAVDRTTTNSSTNGGLPNTATALHLYVSAWHVLDITTPQKTRITYSYEPVSTTTMSFGGANKYVYHQGSCFSPSNQDTETYIETITHSQRIKKIKSNQGSVSFTYDLAREDLKGDHALTSITQNDYNDVVIKKYRFSYDYFVSSNLHKNPNRFGDIDQRTKRLYLQKITEIRDALKNQEYAFSYNTNYTLPDRFSFSTDYWGYYNGKNNDTSIPSVEYYYGAPNPIFIDHIGADKTVDSAYSQAGILTSITYPTKGSIHYTFESNAVHGGNDFFAATRYRSAPLVSGSTIGQTQEYIRTTFRVASNDASFNFPIGGIIDFNYRMTQGTIIPICTGGLDCPSARILDANGTIVKEFTTNSGSFPLADGMYTLELYNPPAIFETKKEIQIHLSGRELIDPTDNNAVFGGLRIKNITTKDADQTQIMKKHYEYKRFDNTNLSSGTALYPPTVLWVDLPFCSGEASTSIQVNSSPIFSLGNESSYSVGYHQVSEYYEGEENGKTEYTFSTAALGFGISKNIFDANEYPNTPVQDFSHRRGLLQKKESYRKNENGSFDKILTETSNYYYGSTTAEIVLGENIKLGAAGDFKNAQIYNNLSERFYLKEQETKQYFYPDNGTTQEYAQRVTYQYDSFPIHNQRTTTTKVDSKGQVLKTEVKYVGDHAQIATLPTEIREVYENLNSDEIYRVGLPIETILYEDGEIQQRQRTIYKEWENSGIYTVKVQTAKREDALEDRILYHKYDAHGNPLEVSQSNGVHIIYIWGYNHQYPIAKIENASYDGMPAALQSQITALQTQSNTENTIAEETIVREALHNLRTHPYFTKSFVTTYTYNPLIGITSVTDPKGYVMTYHYDAFNRLQYVKDAQGNLLSENQYHYKQ